MNLATILSRTCPLLGGSTVSCYAYILLSGSLDSRRVSNAFRQLSLTEVIVWDRNGHSLGTRAVNIVGWLAPPTFTGWWAWWRWWWWVENREGLWERRVHSSSMMHAVEAERSSRSSRESQSSWESWPTYIQQCKKNIYISLLKHGLNFYTYRLTHFVYCKHINLRTEQATHFTVLMDLLCVYNVLSTWLGIIRCSCWATGRRELAATALTSSSTSWRPRSMAEERRGRNTWERSLRAQRMKKRRHDS